MSWERQAPPFRFLPLQKKCNISRWYFQYYQMVRRLTLDQFVVFDIEIKDFRLEVRLVAVDHMVTITYASIVKRQTVLIALTITVLDCLEVNVTDFEFFCSSFCGGRYQLFWEPNWTMNPGRFALSIHALYWLKLVSSTFSSHLAHSMQVLGYESWYADPDLWIGAVL